MHILIIPAQRYATADSPLGGIFQSHQAHALHRAGLQVGVIAPAPLSLRFVFKHSEKSVGGLNNTRGDKFPIYRYHGLNWPTGKIDWLYQAYWNWIGLRLFAAYTAECGRPDIVHAHNSIQSGLFATRFLAPKGIPVVITEHSSLYARYRLSAWHTNNARSAYQNASARLLVSKRVGADLEALFGSAVTPWEVVPNILDTTFEQAPLRVDAKASDRFVFLNVAMMDEVKNQAGLLRAFASALGGRPNVYLRIAGDGPLRAGLESLATSLGIADQVRFLGRLERAEVLSEMQACNAFVLPSFYETFGVVLAEAAACGKPLVSTSGSGPDTIVNDTNGILVPPKDDEALAAALESMFSLAHTYDPQAIREDCFAQFGETAVVSRLRQVYTRVLDQSSRI